MRNRGSACVRIAAVSAGLSLPLGAHGADERVGEIALEVRSAQPEEGARSGDGEGDLAQKLQNPVADLISVPLQSNLDMDSGPEDDGYRYTLNVQPVIPIAISDDWNLITRTIVPLIYQERVSGSGSDFGFGDVVASQFFSPKEPGPGGIIWGVGPVELLPTGTDQALRSEQLGLGPTAVVLKQDGPWTYGMLANHIWGVTDSDDHPDVNATFLQPFGSYTFPDTTALVLNTESTYDWTNEQWTIPVNAMMSRILTVGGQPVALQGGFRWYFDGPTGGPEWGLRFQVTLLFPR